MREILFRGKRLYGDGWVYGDLRQYQNSGAKAIFDYYLNHRVEVDQKTIGQYTGLTDKNGKKIFEGDVLRCTRINNNDIFQGVVVFLNGCFAVQGRDTPAIDIFREYEVIGNIHDNPELIGGESNDH